MYKILEKKEEDYNTISIEKEIRKSKRLLLDISKKAKEEGINLKTKFYDTKSPPDLGNDRICRKRRGKPYCNWL